MDITIKLLSHRDEQAITRELEGMKKLSKQSGVSPEVTTRLKHVITSVSGDDSTQAIRTFVDERLLARDSQAIRNYINTISPDLDLTYNYATDDGSEQEMTVPMTVDFFWPKTGS